jgi:hypothetical protein
MKSFAEFTNKETITKTPTAFPTFEDVAQGKDVAGEGSKCLSDKMKNLIKEMCECGMSEMKACHEDDTEMTAENWMSECDSYMKECMESLKGQCDECMNS